MSLTSLEVSKAVVLRAKELLSRHPSCSVLSRNEFVQVCLTASQRFIANRRKYSSDSITGSTTPRERGNNEIHFTTRDDEVLYRLLSECVNQEKEKLSPRSESRQDGTSLVSPPGGAPTEGGAPREYLALSAVKVSCANIVKSALNPVFATGCLSKQDFANAVIGILDEAFRHPELAILLDTVQQQQHSGDAVILPDAVVDVLTNMANGVAEFYRRRGEEVQQRAQSATPQRQRNTNRPNGTKRAIPAHKDIIDNNGAESHPSYRPNAAARLPSYSDNELEEDEASFDMQVAKLKALLVSAGQSRSASTVSDANVDSHVNVASHPDPSPNPTEKRRERTTALLAELKNIEEQSRLLHERTKAFHSAIATFLREEC